MFNKILRSVFVGIYLILALPIMVVFETVLVLWYTISWWIDYREFDIGYLKDLITAVWEGFKTGMRQNALFIKYGRNWLEKWFTEGTEA